MWPNVGYDGMRGMYYLRVIMLKKLEGMVPVPYPIQNRVKNFQTIDLKTFVNFEILEMFKDLKSIENLETTENLETIEP